MPPRFLTTIAFALVCAIDAFAADLSATVKDDRGSPVEDAVVVASPLADFGRPTVAPTDQVVDQIDKEFVPYVKPVMVGSVVRFPNKDNIRHHVYSFSPAKQFHLPLYSGASASPIQFDKPGVVVLGCNVHDWMIAYIYVADTPYFDKTGKAGKARISNLPPGEYALRVWHPQMAGTEEATTQRVVVTATGVQEAAWQIKLKPEVRVRRAPVPGGSGYR